MVDLKWKTMGLKRPQLRKEGTNITQYPSVYKSEMNTENILAIFRLWFTSKRDNKLLGVAISSFIGKKLLHHQNIWTLYLSLPRIAQLQSQHIKSLQIIPTTSGVDNISSSSAQLRVLLALDLKSMQQKVIISRTELSTET